LFCKHPIALKTGNKVFFQTPLNKQNNCVVRNVAKSDKFLLPSGKTNRHAPALHRHLELKNKSIRTSENTAVLSTLHASEI